MSSMSSSDEDVIRRPGRSGPGDHQGAEYEQGNNSAQNEDLHETNSDNMNGDEDDADLFGSDDPGGEAKNDEYGAYPLPLARMRR